MATADLIEKVRGLEGSEGIIVRFANGHMIKIKAEQYVRIHKAKDLIRTDRHILSLILNNELDDVLPYMDEIDRKKVAEFDAAFHNAFHEKLIFLTHFADVILREAAGDRKKLATELLPRSALPKDQYGFIFKAADGKDMREQLMAYVMGKLGSTTKYNEMASLLGLAATEEVSDEE